MRMWNPYVSAKPVALLRGHNAPIFYLFIAPEENRVFSISTDKCVKVSMITLELSSRLLGIPNDAYMLLSQILIGCSLLSQELIGWYWKIMRRQIYTLTRPIT